MSDSENYEDEEPKNSGEIHNQQQSGSKYSHRTVEEIELNKVIQTILSESQKSQPLFPASLSKKVSESYGLESSQNVFYRLMSNMVEMTLDNLLISHKEVKSTGKYKREGGKDNMLKTVEIQKLLENKRVSNIAKPRLYPEIAIDNESIYQHKMENENSLSESKSKMDVE